jgi:hypothetical protein
MLPWFKATTTVLTNLEDKMSTNSQADEKTEKNDKHPKKFQVQIDRMHYTVTSEHMTGLQLRALPSPPIGADRDLFEVVPGGSDRKIGDSQVVEIRNGIRFFTAPAQINPGSNS